jgi:hypothetical protein
MKRIDETDRAQLSEEPPANPRPSLSRRMFVGAAALAGAGFIAADATAQTRAEQFAGRLGNSPSDPGPENKTLLGENPSANNLPFTDHGNPVRSGTFSTWRRGACRAAAGPIRYHSASFLLRGISPASTCGSPRARSANCTAYRQ